MGAKTGREAKLYYKEGGVASSTGTWTELTNVRDNTLNLEKGDADVTTRGSGAWRQRLTTLIDGGVDFEMVWDPDDAGFSAIHDAFINNNVIGLAILDDESDVGTGLVADFAIGNFTRNEALESPLLVSVKAFPAYSSTAPVWMEAGEPDIDTIGS